MVLYWEYPNHLILALHSVFLFFSCTNLTPCKSISLPRSLGLSSGCYFIFNLSVQTKDRDVVSTTPLDNGEAKRKKYSKREEIWGSAVRLLGRLICGLQLVFALFTKGEVGKPNEQRGLGRKPLTA
ncbi:hypothetical protein NPIL_625481 [Nephila pilipes]|uniref:Uncharacterized protein n=1 Tax=Nephila pilipes TaxID=299642 RepID=A0A8X6PQW9_NEPPI|nr:hypothetical protein NPIL_625481 [Nephila pilipes]